MRPTVISTFAGAGGSSLGYKQAGYRELLAIDSDRRATACFRANFSGVPVWERDIAKVGAEEILEATGLAAGDLDVLDGSPPCQGFSMAGRRRIDDPRNTLFAEFLRLIAGLRPKVFVMENVPGMSMGKYRGVFNSIMEQLRSTGYSVQCKKMNAANYGVPQNRVRLIWIGARQDVGKPAFPRPADRVVTVGEALLGCEPKTFPGRAGSEDVYSCIGPGMSAADCVPRDLLLRHIPRMARNPGRSSWGGCARLRSDRPAPTIMAASFMYGGGWKLHPVQNRTLAIEEIKRLCGFPDDFRTEGSYEDQLRLLGNAVPPPLIRAIAECIRDEMLGGAVPGAARRAEH